MDISQLVFIFLGATAFWSLQTFGASCTDVKKRKPQTKCVDDTDCYPEKPRYGRAKTDSTSFRKIPQSRVRPEHIVAPPGKDARTATVQPIEQPVFASVGWEAEVAELVEQIMPTVESNLAVHQLARTVKQGVSRLFPGAEVIGIASGDFRRGKAFGVAVPEVDIVINLDPDNLAKYLMSRPDDTCPGGKDDKSNAHMQKAAMRIITDVLVSKGRFRFRRSAFRGTEPKVTLLAPAQSGLADFAIPFDLSINSRLPMYNMALLLECERMEPRAKELILLVRRWAKDRGVCFAAKGHLSPYLWTILTIYFLQVDVDEEGPLLPPLRKWRLSSVLNGKRVNEADGWTSPYEGPKKTTAALFKEFIRFYNQRFSWQHEAISIRLGERAPPDPAIPLTTILRDEQGPAENAPTIENPFEARQNLSSTMSWAGVARLREEFVRADKLCSEHASLNDLLVLWAPPDHEMHANDE